MERSCPFTISSHEVSSPGLHVTSGTPQHAYGGKVIPVTPETDFDACPYPHSFANTGILKRSVKLNSIGTLAQSCAEGTKGSTEAGFPAATPAWPVSARAPADIFRNVLRYIVSASTKRGDMWFLSMRCGVRRRGTRRRSSRLHVKLLCDDVKHH